MEKFRETMNVYIEKNKKNSRLNQTEVTEVVSFLKEALVGNSVSISDIINVLVELNPVVVAKFSKTVFVALDKQVKNDFVTSFLLSDKIINNAKNYGITRNLEIVNQLLKTTGNDEYIHTILKFCVKKAYGKDGGQKAGELLSKICFEDTKDKLFLLDYSIWQESELRNYSNWLNNAIAKTTDTKVINAYDSLMGKCNIPQCKKVDGVTTSVSKIDKNTIKPISITKNDNTIPQKDQKEKIVMLISEFQSEVSKIINERLKSSKEIEEVRDKLEQANKDKEGLTSQLFDARNRNDQLQGELEMKERLISEAGKKITEIDSRLKNAFNADQTLQNQELISLKNDLIKRLKLDYEDYIKLASKEASPQYYEALVGVTESIFATLHRKGIIINKENEES